MDRAFRYIEDWGIDTEDSYPYIGTQSMFCWYNSANVGATCTGITSLILVDQKSRVQYVYWDYIYY